MYSIELSRSAEKQLAKLQKNVQKRIVSTLERIRIRPYPHVKKIVGNPYYCLRIGNYRVILDIIGSELIIFVIEIGNRKNIYK